MITNFRQKNKVHQYFSNFSRNLTVELPIELLQQEGFNPAFEKQASFPQAQFMLSEGERLFKSGDVVDPENALPLYVRNEVTWKKVNEQH